MDVLQRYAIGTRTPPSAMSAEHEQSFAASGVADEGVRVPVEFVIVCGDFFHKKVVPPETMNYAVEGLSLLKDHGIPVVMIEGNHDQHYNDSSYSWLRSLSNWNL